MAKKLHFFHAPVLKTEGRVAKFRHKVGGGGGGGGGPGGGSLETEWGLSIPELIGPIWTAISFTRTRDYCQHKQFESIQECCNLT